MFDELIYKYLTDEQREFVDDFDHSILVSASAGTGKTTTMIRKLLHLLLIKKVGITNLLVVTYTTAAASKMKHELYLGLINALHECKDETDIEHINRQIDLLNNADIGTIHSFCNKIIKKYFYVLGVDPNYSILSNEKSKGYLMNNALSNVFEQMADKGGEEFYRLYENFSSARTDDKLRGAVFSLYDYLVCRLDSDNWVKDKIESCYRDSMNNPVYTYLLQYGKKAMSEQRSRLQEVYDMGCELNVEKCKAYAVARLDYCNKIAAASTCKELANVLKVEKLPNKPSIKADKDVSLYDIVDLLEAVDVKFKAAKKELEDIFAPFGAESFEEDNLANKANALGIYRLTVALREEYKRIKDEKNLVDFNDLEYYATKLLEDVKVVCELKEEYKYVFVDEYQDVNPMQDAVISGIAKNNNLYMIGDVKQSIYRFRQNCPEIFIEKYYAYQNGDVDKKLILFNKNFRSDSNILDFVNSIFDHAITKDCVGIDYASEARLVSGKAGEAARDSVHLSLIDAAAIKDSNDDRGEEEDVSKREYEAELIASKVARIVDAGHKFGDIAILLRDKQELARNVWITLKKYNIPVTVVIKAKIFASAEIKVLHSLLKCVYNEADDIAFVTLLKSPFIGATDDELVDIRLCAKDSTTFYEACLAAEETKVSDKVAKLRAILREYRMRMLTENISDIMQSMMEEHNILTYYKSMPDGVEKECYIKEFINIISGEIYEGNLARLLDYLEVIKDKDSEITISSGGDSVTLMTMHASKGLDYPVVIIGGFGDKVVKNSGGDIKINKELGIAVTSVDDSVYEKIDNVNMHAITLMNKKEEFEEAIRLMYVALTRPKGELYITGVVDLSKATRLPLEKCQTCFDLFLLSVSDIDMAYFVNKCHNFVIKHNNGANVICDITLPDIASKRGIESQVIMDVSNPEVVKKLQCYYNMVSPDYSDIAYKNSVSAILRDQEVDYVNALENFRKMKITESVESTEAMEIGTAYHAIMQRVAYHSPQDLKKLVEGLVFGGKINSIYLPMIDISKIAKAKEAVEKMSAGGEELRCETNFLTLAPHKDLINGSECTEEVLVQGIIDLVIEGKNEAIIVDFKTNRTRSKEYLIETYRTQLDLYSKAYEMCYHKSVTHRYLYSFEMGEMIEV